jgi:S-adenosylmethionine:tRNA ribosyltransferase-isomerase
VRACESIPNDLLNQKDALIAHTRILISPGHQFRFTDGLLTNFHLPRSTLLALVGAFMGMELMHEAYAIAVRERYRFYSFGDAMLIV